MAGMAAGLGDEPWKWDVTAYDRPEWTGRFRGRARAASPDGERIFLRFEEIERASYYLDWYMGEHYDTWLMSPNGGRSWQRIAANTAPEVDGVALPDGARLMVTHTCATRRGAALHEYLTRAGLGSLWQEHAFAWWDLAIPEAVPELERRGLYLHHVRANGVEMVGYCVDLSVGIKSPGAASWTWTRIEGLPPKAELVGWWRQTGVVLPDGSVVGCVHGRETSADQLPNAYVLRSADRGRTWELLPLALANGTIGFNESFLIGLGGNRVLAMIRAWGDTHLYRCVSEDGGRTWPAPERTPIDGFPAHILRLRSGALLCTYGRRWYPHGIRGVLSRDDGQTWDVAHEKVLRDDAVGSVGYPFSVQLADGTIFTAYELGKPRQLPPDEGGQPPATTGSPAAASANPPVPNALSQAGMDQPRTALITPLATGRRLTFDPNKGPQSYVAGSRYTEEFVAPLGRR